MDTNLFYQQASLFLQKLADELKSNNISLEPHWNVDHLCYRVATPLEYEACKKDFLKFSELLLESPVNGRPISTFKLFEPVQFLKWTIDVVELPAPKDNKATRTGFEHIEVVVDQPFSTLKKKFAHTNIDCTALSKNWNQELRVKFANCSVKFHQLSLESVVRLEANKPVFSALQRLGILTTFHHLDPLIAGTFPLGIFTTKSDVDILMTSNNLEELKNLFIQKYSHLPEFCVQDTTVQGEPTLLANFIFVNIPFEIFAQSTPSVRQRGYLHFLIEERLLKLKGSEFTTKLRKLRSNGIKTEPAFAQAMNLEGDPYEALLNLQTASDQTLLDIVSL